jgi:hypothetical protein
MTDFDLIQIKRVTSRSAEIWLAHLVTCGNQIKSKSKTKSKSKSKNVVKN